MIATRDSAHSMQGSRSIFFFTYSSAVISLPESNSAVDVSTSVFLISPKLRFGKSTLQAAFLAAQNSAVSGLPLWGPQVRHSELAKGDADVAGRAKSVIRWIQLRYP